LNVAHFVYTNLIGVIKRISNELVVLIVENTKAPKYVICLTL